MIEYTGNNDGTIQHKVTNTSPSSLFSRFLHIPSPSFSFFVPLMNFIPLLRVFLFFSCFLFYTGVLFCCFIPFPFSASLTDGVVTSLVAQKKRGQSVRPCRNRICGSHRLGTQTRRAARSYLFIALPWGDSGEREQGVCSWKGSGETHVYREEGIGERQSGTKRNKESRVKRKWKSLVKTKKVKKKEREVMVGRK